MRGVTEAYCVYRHCNKWRPSQSLCSTMGPACRKVGKACPPVSASPMCVHGWNCYLEMDGLLRSVIILKAVFRRCSLFRVWPQTYDVACQTKDECSGGR